MGKSSEASDVDTLTGDVRPPSPYMIHWTRALKLAGGNLVLSLFVYIQALSFEQACTVSIPFAIIIGLMPPSIGGAINGASLVAYGSLMGLVAGTLSMLAFSDLPILLFLSIILWTVLFQMLRVDSSLKAVALLANVVVALNATADYENGVVWSKVLGFIYSFVLLGPLAAVIVTCLPPYTSATTQLHRTSAEILHIIRVIMVDCRHALRGQDTRLTAHDLVKLRRRAEDIIAQQDQLLLQASYEPSMYSFSTITNWQDVLLRQRRCLYDARALHPLLVPEPQFGQELFTDYCVALTEPLNLLLIRVEETLLSLASALTENSRISEDNPIEDPLTRTRIQLELLNVNNLMNRQHKAQSSDNESNKVELAESMQLFSLFYAFTVLGMFCGQVQSLRLTMRRSQRSGFRCVRFLRGVFRVLVAVPAAIVQAYIKAVRSSLAFVQRGRFASAGTKFRYSESHFLHELSKQTLAAIVLLGPLFVSSWRPSLREWRAWWAYVSFCVTFQLTVEGVAWRAVLRVSGTILGCLCGFFVAWVTTDRWVSGTLLCIFCILASLIGSMRYFGYAGVLFVWTIDMVVLCNLDSSYDDLLRYTLARAITTSIGAIVAVAIAQWVYPYWAGAQVRSRLMDALVLISSHFSHLVHAYTRGPGITLDLDETKCSWWSNEVRTIFNQCQATIDDAAIFHRHAGRHRSLLLRAIRDLNSSVFMMDMVLRRRPPFASDPGISPSHTQVSYTETMHTEYIRHMDNTLDDVFDQCEAMMVDLALSISKQTQPHLTPLRASRPVKAFLHAYHQRRVERWSPHSQVEPIPIDDVSRFHAWSFLLVKICSDLDVLQEQVAKAAVFLPDFEPAPLSDTENPASQV